LANYLIKQGSVWSVKVPIPVDVQPVFDKRAFKRSLKTSDKSVAIARSGPLIMEFKTEIESARGAPTQQLSEYLEETKAALNTAKRHQDADPDALAGIEGEILDRLLAAQGVQHSEQLSPAAEAETIRTYKITTGQLTLFDGPLDEYVGSRKVEPKTAAKDRHAIARFASRVPTVQDVDRQSVRDFVAWLSTAESLKNRTIKDNLRPSGPNGCHAGKVKA